METKCWNTHKPNEFNACRRRKMSFIILRFEILNVQVSEANVAIGKFKKFINFSLLR